MSDLSAKDAEIERLNVRIDELEAALRNTQHSIKYATPIAVCDGKCAYGECVCPASEEVGDE